MATSDVERLHSVHDLRSLVAYLGRELGWPVTDEALADTDDLTFDWSGDSLRLSDSKRDRLAGGQVRQLRDFAPRQPWGIFLVEFNDTKVYRTVLREILRGLVFSRRRDASLPSWKHENLLFVCATHDYERISFAHFRGDQTQKARLATFGWRRGSDYVRTLLEFNLPALKWPDDTSDSAAWLKQWTGAFDKEPLTREFFKRFDKVLERIKADLEEFQSFSSANAYAAAQLLLERLIFLYFLQNRGWLNRQRHFLLDRFAPHRARPEEFSYYQSDLEQIFWTLATAPNTSGYRLEGIPFLNGGLFDDDEFAPGPLRHRNFPPLRIRNSTFAYVFEHLLEAFNFTVREDTPLNQDVAVDPEMLGKVFESIVLHAESQADYNAPDKRKATGSYYTPRIVVHFICRESLRLYLKGQFPDSGWEPKIQALFAVDASDGLDADEIARLKSALAPADGRRVGEVLAAIRMCDPAVGSGAFPVGLLHELVNLRRIAAAVANGFVDPARRDGANWVHDTKAHIVENGLYGVDIQQQAIEICRLRLWLSLIVDYDLGLDPFEADPVQFRQAISRISQLPNLEMNFRRGDSLLDIVCGVPARVALGRSAWFEKERTAIHRLGRELHKAKKGETKRRLRVEILEHRLDMTDRLLSEEIAELRQEDATLAADFFGGTASDAARRRQVAEEIGRLEEARSGIVRDRNALRKLVSRTVDARLNSGFYPELRKLEGADFNSPFNFSWHIDFADIFSREDGKGGFDLILGNPPFVTARNPEMRELYRERWPMVCYREYELVSPFLQLAFGLLNSTGQIGLIVSNGFAMRDFGKPLVERFLPTVFLEKIVDCDGLTFPGHGTPTCILFGRQLPRNETEKGSRQAIVAARLPGGGDLRAVPEESPLWSSLEAHHDEPGYQDEMIAVAAWTMTEMTKWPMKFDSSGQSTRQAIERGAVLLGDRIQSCGSMFDTHKDDAFVVTGHMARKAGIAADALATFVPGDLLRNWSVLNGDFVLKPYDETWGLLPEDKNSGLFRWLRMMRSELAGRSTFSGQTYAQAGEPWYRYHQMSVAKILAKCTLAYPEIATHAHFAVLRRGALLPQTAPVLHLASQHEEHADLLAGLLNSTSVLFFLKQVSFNKGGGKEEQLDRFEYQGKRIRQIPVPEPVAEAMGDKETCLSTQLAALSRACRRRAERGTALSLRKMLDHPRDAYHSWNSSLPGYEPPDRELGAPFANAKDLRAALAHACTIRERIRSEMIALQEEMDWLVYGAYGLLPMEHPAIGSLNAPLPDTVVPLAREERPFVLWRQAEGSFDRAVGLIPASWPENRRTLWRARLEAIRDNEHIRRIEQPVYKRRWDEQWKVGNRWQCGEAAYHAEFRDAFDWWLSEKSEWWLENAAQGGPVELDEWTAALWKDTRVRAAWEVVSTLDGSPAGPFADFARHLRALVKDQTVPADIPWAVPWDDLETKRKAAGKSKIPASAKRIRGKLNVPRERFHTDADGRYLWAGLALGRKPGAFAPGVSSKHG